MKKVFPKKTVYYRTESDDFVTLTDKSGIRIDASYKYKRVSLLQRIGDFIAYRIIAAPCAYCFTKHKLHERFIGKEKLREYIKEQKKLMRKRITADGSGSSRCFNTSNTPDGSGGSRCFNTSNTPDGSGGARKDAKGPLGFFIYSNHTQQIADAFTPNVLTFPRKNSVIIDKNNLSLPLLGRHLKRLGGLPTPEDLRAARNFTDEVARRISRGECVTVYPEAHVWEYYTGIRQFPDSAMDLPIRCSAPVFTATRTFKQGRFGRVACDIYIDGPFFPDASLSRKEARAKLASEVYLAMCERAALSSVEVIRYIKESN